MNLEQSIAIMKALADRSRLDIVNSLLERPHYVEEIAERHALAPSTVSFHLRKLAQAGLVDSRKEQYYTMFHAKEAVFAVTLRELVSVRPSSKEAQDQRVNEYRRRVLESFFRNGRLEKLPAQHKKRLIVLNRFASQFEPDRRYGEQEVTGLILPLFDDYCTIRRLLVDEGMIKREGALYWREGGGEEGAPCAAPETFAPKAGKEAGKNVSEKMERAEIKRLYKQKSTDIGIYQIRNTVNGRIYVGTSQNLEGTRSSRLFQLRMGKIVFSREMQKDLNEYGAESFEFSVLAVLEPPGPGKSVEHALSALELQWLEKLQPFGERGYNSAKSIEKIRSVLGFSGIA